MKKTHLPNHLPQELFAPKAEKQRRYRVPTALEIEALESRVLLSGIGSGIGKQKVVFHDEDGDKVKVFMKKGGSFDIVLDGGASNRADIESITLNGTTDNSRLVIRSNTQKKPGLFTPGITSISSIFADGSLLSISSTAGIVENLEVTGNLGTLNLGLNKAQYQNSIGSPSDAFDLGTVTIGGDLGRLTFSGSPDGENDLVGPISVGGNFNTLDARNSDLANTLTVGGALGRVNVDNVFGAITADDFASLTTNSIQANITVLETANTLNIGATGVIAGVVIDTTGSLNIQIGGTSGTDVFAGTANADGDITLFTETLSPTAVVNAGDELNLRSNNIVGVINAGGAATLTGGGTGFNEFSGTVTAGSVNDGGTIRINESSFTGSITATNGNIGNLLLTQAGALFEGTLSATGNIGNLTGAGFDGLIAEAGGDIGNITATSLGILNSDFEAGDSIGAIDATASGIAANQAIHNSDFTAENGISSVTARSVTGNAISDSNFEAGSFIGDVLGSSTAAGFTGILNSVFDVDDIFSGGLSPFPAPVLITGSAISTITGEGSGSGHGISGTRIESDSGSIGNITGSSSGTGTGLLSVDITASAGSSSIGEIVGNSINGDGINDVIASSGTGGISLIRGANIAAGTGADGIIASVFDTAGSIGSVTGRSTSQHGISTSVFDAQTGIGNVIGVTTGVLESSAGILNSTFRSGGNIGSVTASTGVNGAAATAIGGTAPTITTTTVGPTGFTTSNIAVIQANAGTIFSARGNIGAVNVATGNIDGAVFAAGYDIGNNRVFNGTTASDDLLGIAATSLGSVTVGGGRLVNSILIAGVSTTNNTLGDADDALQFVGSSIGAISVLNSGHITNVVIESGTIGNMTVGGPIDHLNLVGFTTLGNIGITVNASAPGVAAIQHTAIRTPGSIGNISATNTSSTGGDGILNSIFWAGYLNATTENTIGNVTGATSGAGGADGLNTVNVLANGTIGNISGSATNSDGGHGIVTSNVIADLDNDGLGSIGTVTALTNGDNGIAGSDAISSSLFRAGAGIGNISVTVGSIDGGDGIGSSDFFANFDANSIGSVGNIKVTSVGDGDGIIDTDVLGTAIGNITIDPPGDDGIDDSSFIATAGSIGNILITGAGDDAINASIFSATGNIGNITTTSSGSGIVNGTQFLADSDNTDEVGTGGSIGNVSVTAGSANAGTDSGIADASFIASSGIGTVTVNVSGAANDHGILSSIFRANSNSGLGGTPTDGALGNIAVTTNGDGDGINDVTFVAASIGSVSATSVAGSGIVDSFFLGVSNIGDLTVNASRFGISATAFDADSDDDDTGRIGDGVGTDISVTTAGTQAGDSGISASVFTAADGIGSILVNNTGTAGESGIIGTVFDANEGATPETGALGDISSTTAGLGDGIGSSVFFGASIGNVLGSNTNAAGDDGIESSVFDSETSIGNVTGTSLADDAMGSVILFAGTSIGNISGITTTTGNDGAGLISVIADAGTSIGTITGSSGTGSGIENSIFLAGTTMGNISGTSTSATAVDTFGITGSDFDAGGTMGSIVGTSLGTGTGAGGIDSSTFLSGGSVTSILAGTGNSVGSGIQNSAFEIRQNIGNITSTGGIGSTTILAGTDPVNSTAPSTIGNILVLDSDPGSAVNGSIADTIVIAGIIGDGVDGISGTVDDLTLAGSTIGNITAPEGIYSSLFRSGSIGNTLVTAGAIEATSYLATNEAVSGLGIGTISVTNTISADTGDDAILASQFISDKGIGNIIATVNGTRDADDNAAIANTFVSAGLTIGSITAVNNATGAGGASYGIDASRFEAGVRAGQAGAIGAVTASVTSADSVGGSSISESEFDSSFGTGSTGGIASIAATNNGTDGSNTGIDASAFRANGNIGAISSIVSASSLLASTDSIFSASGNIGNISLQGSVLDSQFLAGFDIGSNLTIDLVDVATAGRAIGTVSVTGSFQGSDLVASVDSGVDTEWGNEVNLDNAGGGSIGTVNVALPASATSLLLLDASAANAITADTVFPVQFGGGAIEYNPAPGFEGVPFLAIIDVNDSNVQDVGDIRLVVF